jgi:hypothetical protein
VGEKASVEVVSRTHVIKVVNMYFLMLTDTAKLTGYPNANLQEETANLHDPLQFHSVLQRRTVVVFTVMYQ